MEVSKKTLLVYADENGKEPFSEWIGKLDRVARSRIFARLDRVENGNFGDHKLLAGDIFKLRFQFGPGYRVYFGMKNNIAVILLAGGDKRSQKADIKAAQQMWNHFLSEENNEDL